MKFSEDWRKNRLNRCIHAKAISLSVKADNSFCAAGKFYADARDPEKKGMESLSCFCRDVKKCAAAEYKTEAQVDAEEIETQARLERMGAVRGAIIAHLDGKRSGAGQIPCPCCTGRVMFSRASVNGHIHAKCSTPGCAAWME